MYLFIIIINSILFFFLEKYYLVHATYTHTRSFMTPYRNVRYWLSDFHSGSKVVGKEEIFNLCYARLRNVIERTFGVVKVCFPILKRMTPYSFTTQTKIVMTSFSIHNFLQQISMTDKLFSEYDNEVELESDNANPNQNYKKFFYSIWSRIHTTVLRPNHKWTLLSI